MIQISTKECKYLPKSVNGELRKEEDLEFEPQAMPRVFWPLSPFLLFFFLFLLKLLSPFRLLFVELKLLFELEPDFAESSKLILFFGAQVLKNQTHRLFVCFCFCFDYEMNTVMLCYVMLCSLSSPDSDFSWLGPLVISVLSQSALRQIHSGWLFFLNGWQNIHTPYLYLSHHFLKKLVYLYR